MGDNKFERFGVRMVVLTKEWSREIFCLSGDQRKGSRRSGSAGVYS